MTRFQYVGAAVLTAVMIGLALSACEGLRPETPEEKIIAAEATFTAAVKSAKAAFDAKLFKKGDAIDQSLDVAIQGGNAALDEAQRMVREGFPQNALAWVATVLRHADTITALVDSLTAKAADAGKIVLFREDPAERKLPFGRAPA